MVLQIVGCFAKKKKLYPIFNSVKKPNFEPELKTSHR